MKNRRLLIFLFEIFGHLGVHDAQIYEPKKKYHGPLLKFHEKYFVEVNVSRAFLEGMDSGVIYTYCEIIGLSGLLSAVCTKTYNHKYNLTFFI